MEKWDTRALFDQKIQIRTSTRLLNGVSRGRVGKQHEGGTERKSLGAKTLQRKKSIES